MRQFLNLIGASALCLSLCLGLPEKRRKSVNQNEIFDTPSHLEEITVLDAVFLPTPRPLKLAEGLGAAKLLGNNPNLETITDSDGDDLSAAAKKLNTDDNDTYYFGDDINLTKNSTLVKSASAHTIFVTPSPAQLSIKHNKEKKARKDLENNPGLSLPEEKETNLVTPQTLQSLYKSDFNNKTFKLSLKFPNTSGNNPSDFYNKSLDQLFSSPRLTPETSNEFPLTLIVKQSEGHEEGLDINDSIANDNDIMLTPAFSYNDVEYSGKPQSLSEHKRIYEIFNIDDFSLRFEWLH